MVLPGFSEFFLFREKHFPRPKMVHHCFLCRLLLLRFASSSSLLSSWFPLRPRESHRTTSRPTAQFLAGFMKSKSQTGPGT